eukprot:11558621-Ditylum_brightwellii.AAC.1
MAAFLTSPSLSPSTHASLVRSLFGITGSGDHENKVDGLFDTFAPALERRLTSCTQKAAAEGAGSKSATITALVAVVTGAKAQSDLDEKTSTMHSQM